MFRILKYPSGIERKEKELTYGQIQNSILEKLKRISKSNDVELCVRSTSFIYGITSLNSCIIAKVLEFWKKASGGGRRTGRKQRQYPFWARKAKE